MKQLMIYLFAGSFALVAGILYWTVKQGMLSLPFAICIIVFLLLTDFIVAKKVFKNLDAQADV